MKKLKLKISAFLLLLLGISLSQSGQCQQYPIFTQYMYNGLLLNPAFSGSHESLALTALSRSQWTDIKGAPQTEIFSVHSPVKFSRSAAGAFFAFDRLGVTKQYMIYGTYAYRLPLSDRGKIAFGAQFGGTYYQKNLDDLDVITDDNGIDPSFTGNQGRFLPNIGIGIYYYDKRTYVGLSSPTLINNEIDKEDPLQKARQKRHYFLTAGYVIDLNPNLKLKPNMLIKWVEGGAFQFDVNANLLIKRMVWAGVSFRYKDSIDGLLGWNINDQLSVGYSYGFPITAIGSLRSGTHEIALNFRLKRDRHIIQSPRYF